MAAFIPGLGPVELLIILVITALNVAVPVVVVLLIMRSQKQKATPPSPPLAGADARRCALCDNLYDPVYDACPYCARHYSRDSIQWAAQNLSETKYWSLLIGTALMFVYPAASFFTMGASRSTLTPGSTGFDGVLWMQGLAALLGIALVIAYIVIAVDSPITTEMKIVWVIVVLFGSGVGMAIAFYFLVHRPWKASDGAYA